MSSGNLVAEEQGLSAAISTFEAPSVVGPYRSELLMKQMIAKQDANTIQWDIDSMNLEILVCKASMKSMADNYRRSIGHLRDQELDIKDELAARKQLMVASERLACEFERLDFCCREFNRRIADLTPIKVRLEVRIQDIEIKIASMTVRQAASTEFKQPSDIAASISTTQICLPSLLDPNASESIASTPVVTLLPTIDGPFAPTICSAEADDILSEIIPASIPSTPSASDRVLHDPSLSKFQQEFVFRYVILSIVVCRYEFDFCPISCMQLFGSIFHSVKPLGFILLVFDPGLSSVVGMLSCFSISLSSFGCTNNQWQNSRTVVRVNVL